MENNVCPSSTCFKTASLQSQFYSSPWMTYKQACKQDIISSLVTFSTGSCYPFSHVQTLPPAEA
jgi:hypothetical protein